MAAIIAPLSKNPWPQSQELAFERAIAELAEDVPDQWEKMAAQIPGRSPAEIREQYEQLQHGIELVEKGSFQWLNDAEDFRVQEPVREEASGSSQIKAKRMIPNQTDKRVLWTKEEHRLFVYGFRKHGKKWKKISRLVLPSKTPTQIASHAQKYFLYHSNHDLDKPKKRKRASIHDDSDLFPMQQQLSPQRNHQAPPLMIAMQQQQQQRNHQAPPLMIPMQQQQRNHQPPSLMIPMLQQQRNHQAPSLMISMQQQQRNLQAPSLMIPMQQQQRNHQAPPLMIAMQQQRNHQAPPLMIAMQQQQRNHQTPPLMIPMQQQQLSPLQYGGPHLNGPQLSPPLQNPLNDVSHQQYWVPVPNPMQQLQGRQQVFQPTYPVTFQTHLNPLNNVSHQQNQIPHLNAPQQLSPHQNVVPMQQNWFPPLYDVSMLQLQERQQTFGNSVLAPQQYNCTPPPLSVPVQQERLQIQQVFQPITNGCVWKSVPNSSYGYSDEVHLHHRSQARTFEPIIQCDSSKGWSKHFK